MVVELGISIVERLDEQRTKRASTRVIDVVLSDSGGVYVCSKGNAKQEQKEMRDDGLLQLMMIMKQVKRKGGRRNGGQTNILVSKNLVKQKRGRLGGANKRGGQGCW